ncbi:unnamed protein product [Rhizoctonia solani]|uniref:AMP-dependent synthetase/ligase domain-containing protein n=1 Tax=Rhizoctonia solani TaxID=456999 RepID=A0A8H3CX09_9AGAM|nr:unnamed protein product [Rhizoctonia solani]
MASITPDQSATSAVYAGPLNNDPLTENELAVLLAIPRGAKQIPNATMFRLPLGPEPTQGWIDITFSEARSIVACLAAEWNTRLSNGTEGLSIGPGMTICLLVQPVAHVMLHWLAFWALGCSIQVISLSMDDDTIALYLNKSGCRVVVHSGISDARVHGIRSDWNGTMIRLAEEEHAHQLALSHKQAQTNSILPWPEPKRPDPAIILHSSGSTGSAKLIQYSLYFCTLGIPNVIKLNAEKLNITPDLRPSLLFSPPYWGSFNTVLINQLVGGTPTAFAHVPDISKFPSGQFTNWARGFDVGGIICAPRFIRDILASGLESDISFLRSMYNIAVVGSTLDEPTAALAEKHALKLMNVFGCTELGAILATNRPPYTHLYLFPGPSPLVLPISDTEPDGSRQVQFWYSRSTPRVAHLHAKGGVPLQFEPFPGEGPHKGELAIKLEDVFKEVRSSSHVSYVHLGRADDLIKLAGNGGWDMNASAYEIELTLAITSYLASQSNETGRCAVDAVQLFGNNRPCTALVIQLFPRRGEIRQDLVEHLSNLVELVNNKLKLEPHRRIHPQKRMIIITSEGKAYGPGVRGSGKDVPRLRMTHKHTLQRWKNVEAFGSWLDGLDYSEP